MKINIAHWYSELETIFAGRSEIRLSKKPAEFFYERDGEPGYPMSLAQGGEVFPIWDETGIVIQFDAMPYIRFNPRTRQWVREGDGEYQRTFWISEEGVLGEVDDDDWCITEFFPVRSAIDATQYIELLGDPNLLAPSSGLLQSTNPQALIREIYVRYFRVPDDLSENPHDLCWVKFSALKEIIAEHLSKRLQWMTLPLAEVDRRRLLDDAKKRPKHIVDVTIEDAPPFKMPVEEILLAIKDAYQAPHSELKARCFEVAASLRDDDILSPTKAFIESALRYSSEGGCDACIPFAILLHDHAHPDYFSNNVNPAAHSTLISFARQQIAQGIDGAFLGQPKTQGGQSEFPLPSLFDQKREAFESQSYRHEIHLLAQELAQLGLTDSFTPNAQELRPLLANRLQLIQSLLDQ